MLLVDAFAGYRRRNLRSASPQTLRLWDIALRLLDRHLGRPATLDDLSDETLLDFACWRRQTVAAATTNRDLASLLALWRWCHRRGLVHRWPDVPLEPVPQRAPQAWTQAELSRLLKAARSASGRVGPIPAAAWWPALLLVLFDSGERIGAVLSLKWPQVDLPGCWLTFLAATRKGQRRDLVVRIHPETAALLGTLPHVAAVVLPWPGDRGNLWLHLGRLLRQAGLPSDRHHKFHCLRRTVASHVAAAGGPAQQILDHTSGQTTAHYLDPRIAPRPQAVDWLWRP